MNLALLLTLAALHAGGLAIQPGSGDDSPNSGQSQSGPTDEALLKELEELDARGAKIEDLSADFEQEKHTALLKKPLVSEGRVRVRPPVTRWDTTRPRPSVLALDDRELRMYDPEARTLEVYDIGGGLSRITASPVPRLAAVKEEFRIERIDPAEIDEKAKADSSLAIRLTPEDETIKAHVSQVRVLIDRATACATLVEVTDADGDRTVIRFRNIRTNTGLKASEVALKVPDGTAVSRPLEGPAGTKPSEGGGR